MLGSKTKRFTYWSMIELVRYNHSTYGLHLQSRQHLQFEDNSLLHTIDWMSVSYSSSTNDLDKSNGHLGQVPVAGPPA